MSSASSFNPINKDSPLINNVLDLYDQSTYHFRFFMTEEIVNASLPSTNAFKATGDNLPPSAMVGRSKMFLLAETGSSRVSIDDVSINSIPVSTKKTKTSILTELSFEIGEPSSVTFFDDLAAAATELCIFNLTKCTYYLELTFRGRSRTTSDYEIGEDGVLEDKKWVWPIIIKNIETSINGSGATYSVTAFPYNETGYSNNYGSIKTDIEVPKAKSVGEVLAFIANRINNPPELAENTDGKSIAHPNIKSKNRVVFDLSLWKKDELMFVTSDGLKDRAKEMSNFEYHPDAADGAKMFTFSKGTPYTTIIDICMSLTNFAALETVPLTEKQQKEIDDLKDQKDREELQAALDTKVIKRFYKIHARTANITPDSAQSVVGSGVNLPIGAKMPTFDYSNGLFNTRAEINPLTDDYSKLTVYYVTGYKDSSVLDTANSKANPFELDAVRNSIKKIYNYNFTGLNDQVIEFDLRFNFAFYFDLPSVGGNDKPDGKNTSSDNAAEQTTVNKDATNNKKPPRDFAVAKCLEQRKALAIAPSGDAGGTGGGEGTTSKSYFNSLLDNSMSTNTTGDLINITAKIKGDPYWIGASIPNSTDTLYRLKFETEVQDGDESFWDQQSMFVFRAYQSEEASEGTGTVSRKSSQSNKTISGLYYVIRIKHTFSNGVFTQELESKRETRVGVKQIDKFINEKIGNINT